jgi:dihydroorotate dehydrogenase electron transfer subunit
MEPTDVPAVVEAVEPHPLPYFTLTLRVPSAWAEAAPGQFVMVRIGEGIEPFLRRAFSIHDACRVGGEARIDLLAKVVGPGTARLAASRAGDRLAVLGPLGRGFSLAPPGRAALVAGGVGSAPLLLLAQALARRGASFDFFYGGRSAVDLPRRDRFLACVAAAGGELIATTEDGSLGLAGLVTDPLERALAGDKYKQIYSCGPMALLARLAELGARYGVPGEAALETAMGCGFGACLGCAVPAPEERFVLCCKDGPVFRFDEVAW